MNVTAVHSFSDGDGCATRLLMNLMLLRGYMPVAVRPEDRKAYLDALEHGSLADDLGAFQQLMHERLDATLADYLAALGQSLQGRPVT